MLACVVSKARGLENCAVASEEPVGSGFGDAALALSPKFLVNAGVETGQGAIGSQIKIPIRFVSSVPPARKAVFQESPRQYRSLAPAGPYWPERAQRLGISGVAAIDCLVGSDSHLTDCRVALEGPVDQDFGSAAMMMAKRGWMTAAPLNPTESAPADGRWRFTVEFRNPGAWPR